MRPFLSPGFPALALMVSAAAHAAPLKGKVINPQGQPVPSVYVMAKKAGKITTTDAQGGFVLDIEPGTGLLRQAAAAPELRDGRLAFNVVGRNTPVTIALRDAKGRLAAEVFKGRLDRGRYSLYPMSGAGGRLAAGSYVAKVEVDGASHLIAVRHLGRPRPSGIRFEPLNLRALAKAAGLGTDTLLVSRTGFQAAAREIIVIPDSLPDVVLYPYGYTRGSLTDDQPYVVPKSAGVVITPLLTAGESVKRTSNPSEGYRFMGIPDGMGAYDAGDGTLRLFVNHELRNTHVTHPLGSASPKTGSVISEYVLSRPEAGIISGDYSYTSVRIGDGSEDTAGIFTRFCSGNLAGPEVGLSEPIYFAGEETGTGGFGGKGGEAVAVVGGRARILTDFGRMAYENLVVAPADDASATVVFALEDGPIDSCQLYMYVGAKDGAASGVLGRNGLTGGKMYAFKSADGAKNDEGAFTGGTLGGSWVEITGAAAKTAAQWDADTRSAGAFSFDRIEDGTYDRNTRGVFYFVTTGGSARNPHGRLYKLTFDPANPAGGGANLEILLTGAANSILAPDNIDANADGQILLQEDPTDSSFAHLREGKRNASIWLYDIKSKALGRVAEINEAAAPPSLRNTANAWWETSGIVDASAWFGRGAWIFDVQAHTLLDPNVAALQGLPSDARFAEGGQILLMRISAAPAAGTSRFTDDPAFVRAVKTGVQVKPLFTTGESAPRTSNPNESYRMIGIPDGLGAYEHSDGTVRLNMNHEVRNTAVSSTLGSAVKNGSFITQFVLDKTDAGILSADYAYTAVHVADGTADSAGTFNRFCSGSLAGPEVGLSEPIYFAGEETGTGGYGNMGGEAVAVAGGKARLVPDLGRLAFENVMVVPVDSPDVTVAFSLEDGSADSCQLFMYVGAKNGSASGLLEKNGLTGGKMYAFKANDTAVTRESQFTSGSLAGTWVEIPDVPSKNSAQLEADTRAAGALAFDRIEDGTYDRNAKGILYFVTTGGTARNPHGRLYKLTFDPADPAGGAPGLEIVKSGGPDGFMAPDNIDANADGQIMIQEDPTDSSFAYLRVQKRQPSVWLLDIQTKALSRVLEIDETAVAGYVRNSANAWWETTGIIDASKWWGKGAWLLNVQAHSILDPHAGAIQGQDGTVKLVEGGQLLLVKVK